MRTSWLVLALMAVPASGQVQADAYEVYAAILPKDWTWTVQHAATLVLKDRTVLHEMCLQPDGAWNRILAPAIADYEKANRERWPLEHRIPIEKPYVFAPDFQWNPVLKVYREPSLVEVSAVGFNESRTIAVVYAGHSCGGLCGGGRFYVLERKLRKWQELAWQGLSCQWAS